MASEWHLWTDEQPRPGWANMAIDQALLDRAERQGESWLRLYTWKPYCLSFGRHEPARRRYDSERIAALELDTVRRPTGGRAVWHGRELTYAVASPSAVFGSLRQAYREIHETLAVALRALGMEVCLAPRSRALPLDGGACFAQAAGGEIMAGTRKLVGSAQYRRGSALLQHGSILLEDDQHIVNALAREPAAGVVTGWPRTSRPMNPMPLAAITAPELGEAIAKASRSRWPDAWRWISDPAEILEEASSTYPQFRSPAWTWKR
jgi:lipoate-protein ligase A